MMLRISFYHLYYPPVQGDITLQNPLTLPVIIQLKMLFYSICMFIIQNAISTCTILGYEVDDLLLMQLFFLAL